MSSFTNHLVHETSPYLLQHAHNPVNWYPWGQEALELAVTQDKPILVSIGYSACHWCHVMERESFEDDVTANLMNDLFINIKIDREERPDLDHIYMDAVQAIAGNGGWPLNVFLTPSAKPFYGGTYFPPVRAFNRSSWKEVLMGVSALFTEKRHEVEAQAEELMLHLTRSNANIQTKVVPALQDDEVSFKSGHLDTIFQAIMKQADKDWGGFGNAPKFPQTFIINYLFRYQHYTGDAEALSQACLSLDKMIEGGIFDQLGGGFARYSTDREWFAPHFEKMLYDNALLVSSLADAFRITRNERYKVAIEDTVRFIERELTNEHGAFFAALDADSEGVEGKFYVWSYEEVRSVLGEKGELFCDFYDISPHGNWEHTNILRTRQALPEFAARHNLMVGDVEKLLEDGRNQLFEVRAKRIRPSLDDKIIVAWNALMISSLCKASAALSEPRYISMAIKCFDYIWTTCRKSEGCAIAHTFKNGIAKYPGFLDDYAELTESCILLQEVTSEPKYLDFAAELTRYTLENFSSGSGYFYFTAVGQTDVIMRKIEFYDGATASGNSTMGWVLHYLGTILDNPVWKQHAVDMIRGNLSLIEKYPSSFGNWACLLADFVSGINELAIIGTSYQKFRDELLKIYIPNSVLQCATRSGEENYPLLKSKPESLKPLLYLCRDYACQAPVEDVETAINLVLRNSKYDNR